MPSSDPGPDAASSTEPPDWYSPALDRLVDFRDAWSPPRGRA